MNIRPLLLTALSVALLPPPALAQTANLPSIALNEPSFMRVAEENFDISSLPPSTFDADAGDIVLETDQNQKRGIVSRSVRRTLQDQKQLYFAPFKPSNFKWDALVLGGTTVLLIEDRHIENQLSKAHYRLYQDSSDIAIAGLGAGLAGVWMWGIKGNHPHAREMGNLELETLVNTFLIYTPMQLIGARQRPGEGNGHGDFRRHSMINTSFPAGHAMFSWSMATVVAHEYPKPWVKVLAYGTALTITADRFLARDHWASDTLVGSALGIAIGSHIFHSRCDPEISESCKHHFRKFKPLSVQSQSADSISGR